MTQKQNEIPKQTRLVMDVTRTIPASPLTAQAAAALIMGASYVGNLAHEGVEAGVLTPQEGAAIQGVVELAMQVWKFHAVNGTINENA